MGQKTHPVGFRLGVVRGWTSKWYSEKDFSKWLHEDLRLKKFVKQKLGHAGVSSVEVERAANKVKINIFTARPGIVIGKKGADIENLRSDIGLFGEMCTSEASSLRAKARISAKEDLLLTAPGTG